MPTKLEDYAVNGFGTFKGRNSLLAKNIYKEGAKAGTQYSATHTRAISDQTTANYGKGSGGDLDVNNYNNVGSDWDKNGNANIAMGSGRNPAFAQNLGKWGYDPTHYYKHPDLSKSNMPDIYGPY